MSKPKGFLDSMFDVVETVVDGAQKALADVPEPDGDEDERPSPSRPDKVVIDIPPETTKPLLKSGTTPRKARELPREVHLQIRNISKRPDGKYSIIAEMETHEVVAVVLSEEDWNKIVDTAAWLE